MSRIVACHEASQLAKEFYALHIRATRLPAAQPEIQSIGSGHGSKAEAAMYEKRTKTTEIYFPTSVN